MERSLAERETVGLIKTEWTCLLSLINVYGELSPKRLWIRLKPNHIDHPTARFGPPIVIEMIFKGWFLVIE